MFPVMTPKRGFFVLGASTVSCSNSARRFLTFSPGLGGMPHGRCRFSKVPALGAKGDRVLGDPMGSTTAACQIALLGRVRHQMARPMIDLICSRDYSICPALSPFQLPCGSRSFPPALRHQLR